jgi:hypothetical protein
MGFIICRARDWFCRSWLVREFPIRWGSLTEAIIYPRKGDARRIKTRIGDEAKVHDASKHGAGS